MNAENEPRDALVDTVGQSIGTNIAALIQVNSSLVVALVHLLTSKGVLSSDDVRQYLDGLSKVYENRPVRQYATEEDRQADELETIFARGAIDKIRIGLGLEPS